MLKLFIALNFFFINIYACKGGFDSCKQKIIDSNSIINQTLQIPVKNSKRLLFSTQTPKTKILKYDPFLSLYLVEDSDSFKHPFRINNGLSLGAVAINNRFAKEVKIVKKQIGLNTLATYNESFSTPSLLLNSCCSLEGLITPKGIIEKEYIERFLKIKKVSYSDIGIRVVDEKKSVIVNKSNPFMKLNPFKKNDHILELNGKKVKNSATFMRDILFSKIGSTHKIKIKRDSKIVILNAKSQKRTGGGFLNDTFLEFLGLFFDENLSLIKIEKKALKYQLKLKDKLLQLNGEKIKTKEDILNLLKNSKNSVHLLFQRNQLQFFIKVN
jgi:hypothetical protein